jgi:hypothetical protein
VRHRSKLFDDEIVCVDGICLTTGERTWLELAEALSVDSPVVLANHLVRIPRPRLEERIQPYAGIASLRERIGRHPHKRGIRKARRALEQRRTGVDAPQETRLRLALVRAGLPEPAVNRPIMDANGNVLHFPGCGAGGGPDLQTAHVRRRTGGGGQGQGGAAGQSLERRRRPADVVA